MSSSDTDFMRQALTLAARALDGRNMGCGAVIVRDGRIVGSGFNAVIESGDPTSHAEIMAVRDASRDPSVLDGATLYTTMEPCPMCLWAALVSGVKRVVIGCRHSQLEAGVRTDLADYSTEAMLSLTGRRLELSFGLLAEECETARRQPFGQ